MTMLWLDYETYYDTEYSLSAKGMTRTQYLNDQRFKAHGCSFAIDEDIPFWVTGTELPTFFEEVGPHVDSMCCHNGLFDHGITGLFYMPERKVLCDTMSMAQVAIQRQFPGQRMSLARLAQFLFPGDESRHKWEDVLADYKGVWQLTPEQEKRMAGYANQDNHVMREIFKELLKQDQPWVTVLEDISLTLGMGVYPQLQMDTELAAAINAKEEKEKNDAVKALNLERSQLRSGEQFAQLLRDQGVSPPMKPNTKGDKMIYAFAAKDLDFMALAEHENPVVRALQSLRIGEKSAQTMTRSARFAQLPVELPIPLKVAAAHTGRHGGEEYNMQNLGRKSALRQCIRAPKGYKLVVGDLSGIELRVNGWWCDERSLLDNWSIDAHYDVYSDLASTIYGRLITKQTGPDERFNGKTSELACQYGAGEDRIKDALLKVGVPCDSALAKQIKKAYRSKRTSIVKRWKWLQEVAIPAMAGLTGEVEMKGVRFVHGRAILPSGRSLWYPDLRVNEAGDWVYKTVKNAVYEKKLYGGAFLENLIQAMSYDVFMYQQRIAAQKIKPLAMAVHDEAVYVIENTLIEWATTVLKAVYQMAPGWFNGVPIFGEFGLGESYDECK